MKCDLNLAKVNVIKINETDPDVICLDVEVFASLLASEDVKLLANVSKKVKVENPKATKQKTKDRMIAQLKSCFECKNADVLFAIRGWIDSICTDPTKYLSKQQVLAFKSKLDDYCDGDAKKALAIHIMQQKPRTKRELIIRLIVMDDNIRFLVGSVQ